MTIIIGNDSITELCCSLLCLFCANFCCTMCFEAWFGHLTINKAETQENRKKNWKINFHNFLWVKFVEATNGNQAYSINHDNDICRDRAWNYNPNRFSPEPSAQPQVSAISSNPVGTEVITTQPHRSDSEIIFGVTTPNIEEINSPPPLYGSWFTLNDSRNELAKY